MLLNVVALAAETVNGTYPGGSSESNPVPQDIQYYLPDWGYGLFAFALLAIAVYAITRLTVDR